MALARIAKEAVSGLGLRCGATSLLGDSSALVRSLATRGYATGRQGGDLRGRPPRASPPLGAGVWED